MDKTWAIPPKYMSSAFVFAEVLTLDRVLADMASGYHAYENELSTFANKYIDNAQYLYLRYRIVIDESERRGFPYSMAVSKVPKGNSESPFECSDTERDIAIYVALIEEMQATSEYDRISMLNLLSPEDVFLENEFLISTYAHEILGEHCD